MDKRVAATARRRSAARCNQGILIARTVLTTCAPCYPLTHGDICSRTASQSIRCALSVLSVMNFFRRLPSPLFLTGGILSRTLLPTHTSRPFVHSDICSRTAPQSIRCALSVLSVMKFFRRLPSPLFLTGGDLSRTLLPTHAPRPFAHRVTPLAQLCRSPVCFVRGQSACYAVAARLLALVYTAQQHSLSFFGTQWHAVSVSSA